MVYSDTGRFLPTEKKTYFIGKAAPYGENTVLYNAGTVKEEIILEFEIIKDILSVLGNVINGLSGIIMGLSFGFLSAPTALGYCAGIIGMLAFKTVIPINIQGETIVLAGSVGKNFRERISIVFYSGVIMVILGGLGLLQRIVDFAGSFIISGMEAGVGIIVIRVAIDLIRESKKTGAVSLVSAFAAYFLTKDLNWTLVISMAASIACFLILNKGPMEEVKEESKFKFFKPVTNFNVIRGALALACLSIGTNIAYSGIVSGMAGMENPNVDGLTIYSGAADILTGLFGGTPVEITLSSTAAAPHPVAAGILLMVVMALILFARLVPKIARFIPAVSISGFLFVLGSMVSVPQYAAATFEGASQADALAGGATIAVTALIDPFVGLLAGIVIRFLSVVSGLAV